MGCHWQSPILWGGVIGDICYFSSFLEKKILAFFLKNFQILHLYLQNSIISKT
jgi:hypothetical protein